MPNTLVLSLIFLSHRMFKVLYSRLKNNTPITMVKSFLYLIIIMVFAQPMTSAGEKQELSSKQAPQSVRIEKVNQSSFTIVWKRPVLPNNKNHKLLAFSISCFLLEGANPEERQIVLPPIATSKQIDGLREGTNYEVSVWAVYSGNHRIAAPSIIIETQFSVATEKHLPPENSPFLEKDDFEEIKCKVCLPGHRGHLCSSCTAGYRWNNDRCIPSKCFSFPLCIKNKNHPGCSDCVYLMDIPPSSTAHKTSEGTVADGTLPLVGVIVILGIILLIAVGATGYHLWSQPHLNMGKEHANNKKTLITFSTYAIPELGVRVIVTPRVQTQAFQFRNDARANYPKASRIYFNWKLKAGYRATCAVSTVSIETRFQHESTDTLTFNAEQFLS
ncbi:uncharacterized protein LOC143245937 [Tachypleus tridentatus]|uniref:uncharacterized protein LOC143245937 n=1 Tax=Tachypleus tridentatus TaxID=6853 RepID=UPI003FD3779B